MIPLWKFSALCDRKFPTENPDTPLLSINFFATGNFPKHSTEGYSYEAFRYCETIIIYYIAETRLNLAITQFSHVSGNLSPRSFTSLTQRLIRSVHAASRSYYCSATPRLFFHQDFISFYINIDLTKKDCTCTFTLTARLKKNSPKSFMST